MGNFVFVVKKWWLLAVVFTLAMSLTSCSSKTKKQLQSGQLFSQCTGNYYSFDIYVLPDTSSGSSYMVAVVPQDVNEAGDQVTISFGSTNGTYQTKENDVALIPGQEIDIRTTLYELQTYNILTVVPVFEQANPPAGQRISEKTTLCEIPVPGTTQSNPNGSN